MRKENVLNRKKLQMIRRIKRTFVGQRYCDAPIEKTFDGLMSALAHILNEASRRYGCIRDVASDLEDALYALSCRVDSADKSEVRGMLRSINDTIKKANNGLKSTQDFVKYIRSDFNEARPRISALGTGRYS